MAKKKVKKKPTKKWKKTTMKTSVDVKQDLFQIYRDVVAMEAACIKIRERLETAFGKANETFIVPITMSLWAAK